jgi:hypothetical protein
MRRLMLVTLIVLALNLGLSTRFSPRIPDTQPILIQQASPGGIVAVDPTNQSSLTPFPNNQVEFAINLTSSILIHSFYVQLSYNRTVLSVANKGVDPMGGILGSNVGIIVECVDGQPIVGGGCGSRDSAGVVTLVVAITGKGNAASTGGILFTVLFNIVGTGLSEIHLLVAAVTVGLSTSSLGSQTNDGYFSNRLCGPRLCQPPVANFFISPPPPIKAAKPVTFNASSSSTPNSGGSLTSYHWDWGEGDLTDTTRSSPVIDQTYYTASSGVLITLRVTDSWGVSGSKTIQVQVSLILLDLGINIITADPHFRVISGTPIRITAIGQNFSTRIENVTLAIRLLDRVVMNQTFPNVPAQGLTPALSYTWNTSGLSPRVYKIDAIVSPLTDPSGNIIEDNILNNVESTYVQLVSPIATFGLSLLQTAGVSVIALVGLGALAAFILKKKPTPDSESLN